MARGDGDVGERVAQRRDQAALVLRVAEGEQQGDGQRIGRGNQRAHRGHHPLDLVLAERLEHAPGAGPLRDPHDVGPRDQRGRVVAGQVVQRRPILAPQPQKVFEALGRHERDAGSAALEQGVGGNRGTVNEQLDGGRRLERVQRVKQADGGIFRRRHHLADFDRPIIGERDEIGEGSADIHPHPHPSPPPTPVRNAEWAMRN